MHTHREKIDFRFAVAVLLLAVVLLPRIAGAELTARVGATQITIEQTLRLVITSTLPDNNEQPDLNKLVADFEVLGRSEQTSMQTSGGRTTRSRSWHIELAARRQGVAVIPSFQIGGESTQPISITVTAPKVRKPGEDGGDYFIEVAVDKTTAWVQSQIIYTLRIFSIQNFLDGSLSEVAPAGMQVQELGESRSYHEKINGRSYQVLEKQYALFPQNSGEQIIPAVQLNASVPMEGSRNRGIFTPGRTIRRKSEELSITVLPRPENSGGNWWLPASDVQLSAQWETGTASGTPVSLRVGDSLTRNIAIMAEGAAGTQLPALDVPPHEQFKIYASQPQFNEQSGPQGLRAVRQEKWAVVAVQAGTFSLPEIRVPWFNTETGQSEVAILPAETLTVLPAENSATDTQSRSAGNEGAAGGGGESGTQAASSSPAEPSALLQAKLAGEARRSQRWQWTALLLGAGWLLTAALLSWLLWGIYRRRRPVTTTPGRRAKAASFSAVQAACAAAEPRAAASALLDWAATQWPQNPPRALVALAERFESASLKADLLLLDSSLYAASSAAAQGGSRDRLDAALASMADAIKGELEHEAVPEQESSSALPGL